MDEKSQERGPAQFSVYLPAEMADEIDGIVEQRLSSRAGVIREALSDWLARQRRMAAAEAVA